MKTKAIYPSVLDFTIPNQNILTNALAVLAGSFLIVLSANIYIPLPFTPVPITAQTLSVMLVGSLLGSKRAPLSVLLYILYGALGYPVFAEHSGGLQVLVGPTAGYIAGFILAGHLVGKFTEKGWDRTVGKSLVAMSVGQLIIFVPGLLWLGQFVGYENVLEKGFYPFVIGGIIKTLLAGSSSVLGWKMINKLKQ